MRVRLPESKRARWAIFGGAGVAILILSVVAWSWRSISDDAIEVAPGEIAALEGEEQPLVPASEAEEVLDEFEELGLYGNLTPEELASLLDEARRQGRLIDESFESTVDRGVPIRDEDFDTFLLIGSDESGALADVLIYVLEPTNGGAPIIVSLPRDLYIESPCTERYARINVNLNGCGSEISGPVLVAVAVQQFTGVPVDHFVVVDFEGFADVIDAVGGVELCFDEATRDINAFLDVPAGCQIASGDTALAWVRSRHTQVFRNGAWVFVGASDFTRQDNQQDVLWLLTESLTSFDSLTSFASLVTSLSNSVRIDENWTMTEVASDVWNHREVSRDDVERITLVVDDYRTETGAAVLVPTVSFTDLLAEVYP